jgi:hypothetical protein
MFRLELFQLHVQGKSIKKTGKRSKRLRSRGVAPHPVSFFLKKKETKKITFADGM